MKDYYFGSRRGGIVQSFSDAFKSSLEGGDAANELEVPMPMVATIATVVRLLAIFSLVTCWRTVAPFSSWWLARWYTSPNRLQLWYIHQCVSRPHHILKKHSRAEHSKIPPPHVKHLQCMLVRIFTGYLILTLSDVLIQDRTTTFNRQPSLQMPKLFLTLQTCRNDENSTAPSTVES